MNVNKMIDQLRAELAAIQQALTVLENLSGGHGSGRKRKPFSAETRRKMALSQRKRWAAFRKDQKQTSRPK
jgi:hypothetical protein